MHQFHTSDEVPLLMIEERHFHQRGTKDRSTELVLPAVPEYHLLRLKVFQSFMPFEAGVLPFEKEI